MGEGNANGGSKSANRYTTRPEGLGEILQAVQRVVSKISDQNEEIGPYDRIDKCFERCGVDIFDHDALEELSDSICNETGITLDQDDWNYLTGLNLCATRSDWEARYADLFTFGRLTFLLAARLKLPSINAANLGDQSSMTAGAFCAIQEVLLSELTDSETVTPSTPIVESFAFIDDIQPIWSKFRVMSQGRLPPLGKTRLGSFFGELRGGLGCFLSLAIGMVMFSILLARYSVNGVVASIVGIVTAFLAMWLLSFLIDLLEKVIRRLSYCTFRLPNDIETYGDVARIMSGERGGWCKECGYDLTGIVDDRCPECGVVSKPSFVFPTRRDQST